MGIIDKLRYKDIKGALTKNIVWFIFEAGIIFIALSMVIPSLATIGMAIGGVCIAITVGLLLYGEGVCGVMNIFTFVGNILSYARLLAMCLSTAGIAITANILAQIVFQSIPIEIIAWIFGIITFIFGHVMNILIQIVGGFINTMRLHFVEFFTHFYIGGRNSFEPFSSNREITKLKK
jgi:V/A-type H+-transporting ATPase subunit I